MIDLAEKPPEEHAHEVGCTSEPDATGVGGECNCIVSELARARQLQRGAEEQAAYFLAQRVRVQDQLERERKEHRKQIRELERIARQKVTAAVADFAMKVHHDKDSY